MFKKEALLALLVGLIALLLLAIFSVRPFFQQVEKAENLQRQENKEVPPNP